MNWPSSARAPCERPEFVELPEHPNATVFARGETFFDLVRELRIRSPKLLSPADRTRATSVNGTGRDVVAHDLSAHRKAAQVSSGDHVKLMSALRGH
jgi:hypothetical protein